MLNRLIQSDLAAFSFDNQFYIHATTLLTLISFLLCIIVAKITRATAPKPAVPKRDEKPIHGLVSDKNFIVANAVENILAGKYCQQLQKLPRIEPNLNLKMVQLIQFATNDILRLWRLHIKTFEKSAHFCP